MSRPAAIQPDFSLARLTTVRTCGPAEFFARAGDEETLRELLSKAERDCFIGASLAVKPTYRWRVNGAAA